MIQIDLNKLKENLSNAEESDEMFSKELFLDDDETKDELVLFSRIMEAQDINEIGDIGLDTLLNLLPKASTYAPFFVKEDYEYSMSRIQGRASAKKGKLINRRLL